MNHSVFALKMHNMQCSHTFISQSVRVLCVELCRARLLVPEELDLTESQVTCAARDNLDRRPAFITGDGLARRTGVIAQRASACLAADLDVRASQPGVAAVRAVPDLDSRDVLGRAKFNVPPASGSVAGMSATGAAPAHVVVAINSARRHAAVCRVALGSRPARCGKLSDGAGRRKSRGVRRRRRRCFRRGVRGTRRWRPGGRVLRGRR